MITALLPSRGRPEALAQSIRSLRERAERPELVQIIAAADPDDSATVTVAHDLGVSCWIAPQRYGYSRLNLYFNQLAALSCTLGSGHWLMLWNDDARMLTDGWDYLVNNAPRGMHVLDPWVDRHSPDLCTFPIISGEIYQAAGGYSPHTCHCDTWWQDIGRALGVIAPVPIHVDHQRADLTGKHNDTTYHEGLAGYRSAEFYGPEVQGHMRDTIERIREAML